MNLSIDESHSETEPATGLGWAWLPMLLMLGYLLFAHGCHGDEDNELFMRLRSGASAENQRTGVATPPN